MIVYVHDKRSPWNHYRRFNRDLSEKHFKLIIVNSKMSIPQIVQAIMIGVGSTKTIWRLMLMAHGNAGYLQLGKELNEKSVNTFRLLKPYFTPKCEGIEIHGCAVASSSSIDDSPFLGLKGRGQSGGKGDRLVRELAWICGVYVKAAIDAQRVDYDGLYNGPYMIAKPNGSVHIASGQHVTWIR